MTLTPLDVQKHKFSKVFRGYSCKEVDELLQTVRIDLETLLAEKKEIYDELSRKNVEIDELRAREEMIKNTLTTAQRLTEEIRHSSHRESEVIVAQAEAQADRIVNNAQQRIVTLVEQINELKRQRQKFEAEFGATLQTYVSMLRANQQSREEIERQEDKVSYLRAAGGTHD